MDDLEKTLQQVALARESTLILRDGFGGWSKFKLSLSPTDSSLPTFPGGPHRLLFRPTNFPPSPILLNIGPVPLRCYSGKRLGLGGAKTLANFLRDKKPPLVCLDINGG